MIIIIIRCLTYLEVWRSTIIIITNVLMIIMIKIFIINIRCLTYLEVWLNTSRTLDSMDLSPHCRLCLDGYHHAHVHHHPDHRYEHDEHDDKYELEHDHDQDDDEYENQDEGTHPSTADNVVKDP